MLICERSSRAFVISPGPTMTTTGNCTGVELRVVFAHGGIHALDIPFVRRDRCRYRHVARALRRRGAKPEIGSAPRAPNRRWQAADGRPEVAPVGPRLQP